MKKITPSLRWLFAALATTLLATASPALAQLPINFTNYWLGSNGTSWTAGNNWSTDAAGTTPADFTSGYNVVFSATGSSNSSATDLGGNLTIGSLTVERGEVGIGNGTLTINASSATALTVNATAGNVTISAPLVLEGSASTLSIQNTKSTLATIAGSNGLTKTGNGTLILTGNSTYTGGTTISNGTLQLGDGGSSGSIQGNISLNNTTNLIFNRSDVVTFGGNITGTGAVLQNGNGTTVLTGRSNYSGGTAIKAGALEVSGGGNISGGSVFMENATYSVIGNGTASHINFFISNTANTTSTVNVNSGGNVSASNAFFVGYYGNGSLNVSGTGRASAAQSTFIASEVGSTGILNVTDNGTLSAGYLAVGNRGAGTINITSGGNVTASRTQVGVTNTSNGTIFMNAGTLSTGPFTLGQVGGGTLLATNNSTLTATGAPVMIGASGVGNATFNASAFNIVGQQFFVGSSANGTLILENGSKLNITGSNNVFIAAGSGVTGVVTVTGNGSSWQQSGQLYIGNSGNGTFNILDGATATSGGGNAFVGAGPTSTGRLRIDGASSNYTIGGWGDFSVGGLKSEVIVSDGGFFETKGRAFIAAGSGTSANVTVTGVGSRWRSLDYISVGQSGTAILTVADGGVAQVGTSGNGTVYIGDQSTGGTLNIGAGVAAGKLEASTVTGGFAGTTVATINFNHTDSNYIFTNTGNASGTGIAITGNTRLNVLGGGSTTLISANNYTGGTTISAGTLSLGNGGTSGSVTGNITNNGNLVFNRSNDVTFSGAISGNGALQKLAANTLTLTSNNTYTGGTTITGGTLSIGDGGTSGSVSGNIINNAVLAINRSDDVTFAGAISGNGALQKLAANTLTLTSNNTYTGGTAITGGTLSIGDGGTSGSVSGNIINNAVLAINRSDDVTFAGAISGNGAVEKLAANNLTLTGNSTYTGATTISSGTLSVTGSLNGTESLTLNNASKLNITGAVTTNGAVNANTGTITIGQGGSITTASSMKIEQIPSLFVSNHGFNTLSIFDLQNNHFLNSISGNLSYPGGVAVDGSGNIYVGNVNNDTLIKFSSNGTSLSSTSGNISRPFGVGIDGSGNIYVSNYYQNTLSKFSSNGTFLSSISGNMTGPFGVGIDGSGNIYVSNAFNNTLSKFSSNGTFLSSISGNMSSPRGVAIDGSDNIYVVNSNGTLSKFSSNGTFLSSISGNMSNPYGVAIDGSGNIYVTNFYQNTLSKFSSNGSFLNTISGNMIAPWGVAVGNFTMETEILHGLTLASAASDNATLNIGTLGGIDTTATLTTPFIAFGNGTAALNFNLAGNTTLSAALTGGGANSTVNQLGSGTTALTGNNSYTGAVNIESGTLAIGDGGTTGTLASATSISNNATLAFNRTDDYGTAYSTGISGSGAVVLKSGSLTLTGNNTYTGGTTISSGTLALGNGSTSGFVSGDITNNGVLAINRSNDVTLEGAISGNGALQKLATNTLTLTGNNTYTGTTTISSGTLAIGNGGTSGSLAGDITNNATLVFNRSNDSTYAGAISGNGVLEKLGSGTTTLAGNSTYTGGTTVNAGALNITGSVNGTTLVEINGASSLAITGSLTANGAVNANSGTITIGQGGALAATGNTTTPQTFKALLASNRSSYTIAALNMEDANSFVTSFGNSTVTNAPAGIAFGPNGNIYVASYGTNSISIFSPDGNYTGNITGNLNQPHGLAFDSAGNLYVANYGSNSASIFAPNGTYTGNITANLSRPTDVVFDSEGKIYISNDGSNSISVFAPNGTYTGNITGNLNRPYSMALGSNGSLYVVNNNNNCVSIFSSGGLLSGNITSNLSNPFGSVVNTNGDLYVANYNTSKISIYSSNGTYLSNISLDFVPYGLAIGNFTTDVPTPAGITLAASASDNATLNIGTYGGTDSTASVTTPFIQFGNGTAALNFNLAGNTTLAAALTGGNANSTVNQLGTGTTTLTSTNSTFAGTVNINSGTLAVSGSLVNATTRVNTGGTLAGTGTLGNVTINSGGAIAPGNSPGTISVGNLTLSGGSIYNWQTSSVNGTAGTDWDLINSSGSLTLNATAGNRITLSLSSLGNATLAGVKNASWQIGNFTSSIIGFDAGAFSFNSAGMNGTVGRYFMTLGGENTTLVLNYKTAATWNSGNGVWTTASQWENESLPQNGDQVEFTGIGGTSTNNFASGNLSNISGIAFLAGAGAYTVNGNTLQIGEDGIINSSNQTQTIAMDLTAGEVLAVNADVSGIVITGVISGNSSLTKTGSQVLILSGNNTYTGGTTISAGTLALGGTAGSVLGNIIVDSGATLAVSRSNNAALSNLISGAGSFAQVGPGVTSLLGNNTYTGGTSIYQGTLWAKAPQALGTGGVTLSGGKLLVSSQQEMGGNLVVGGNFDWTGGSIAYYDTGTSPASGDITIGVAGNFTATAGNKTFDFSGVEALDSGSYTLVNATTISAIDTTFLAVHGPNTTLFGNFTTNGTTIVYTVTGAVSGGTDIQNNGGPNTPVIANYNVTGPTVTIGANNLVNALTFSGSAPLAIQSNGELTVTSGTLAVQSGSSVVSGGTLNTPGNFDKTGAGELDLQSNTNVGGIANVVAGLLSVNGQLNANSVVVDPTATLGGSGLIVASNVNVVGRLAPGNSPGTLTIAGNLNLNSASTTVIEIASPTNFDRIVVSGTATLGGTLSAVAYGGGTITPGTRYDFLQAGSIVGAYDSLIAPDGLRIRFLNSGTVGSLLFGSASFVPYALNPNQVQVAKVLDIFVLGTKADAIVVGTALDSLTADQYPVAFNAIMPGFYESLANLAIEQAFNQTQMLNQRISSVRLGVAGFQAIGGISQPLVNDKNGKSASDAKDKSPIVESATSANWNSWALGTGMFSRSTNLGSLQNYNNNAGGFLVGTDYRWSENFVTGLYAGYEYSYAKYNGGSSTRGNSVDFGTYASYEKDGYYADAVIGGGYTGYQTRRAIQFGTIDRTATATPGSGQFTAGLNLGKDFEVGKFTLGPIVGAQYTYAGIGSFTESGADSLDLALGQQNANSLRSTLGGRVAYTWNLNTKVALIPEVRMFWQHEFLNNPRNISSALEGGSGPSFDYETTDPYRNSVFAGAGVTAKFGKNLSGSVFYNINFGGQTYQNNMVSAGLNLSF